MDMLKRMFEMQEHLDKNVATKCEFPHYNSEGVTEADRRERCDNLMSALQGEVCETREALTQRVKWWKNKTKDMAGVREEIIDCWHFLMSASLASGMTAEDVFKIYNDKNAANFTRKDWTINQDSPQMPLPLPKTANEAASVGAP